MTMSASAANACSMSAAATTLRPSVASFALVGSRKVQGQAKIASVQSNGGWSSAQLLKMLGHDTRADGLQLPRMQITASVGRTEESDVTKKTETYSDSMQQAMGSGLTYRHELGMNYAHVLPDLIVGSCPQTPSDVDRLKGAGVGTIFCLQQDPDLAYFSVDICAIQERAKELDGIEHIRAQIRDFDPYDLRLRLPKVVAELYKATKRNEGTAYVHCTAGLGRAPAVALTYMYWIRGYELFEANAMLQKVRSCHPKLDSIKAATADMLTGNAKEKVRLSWWRGAAESVEVAGLDVGWYEVPARNGYQNRTSFLELGVTCLGVTERGIGPGNFVHRRILFRRLLDLKGLLRGLISVGNFVRRLPRIICSTVQFGRVSHTGDYALMSRVAYSIRQTTALDGRRLTFSYLLCNTIWWRIDRLEMRSSLSQNLVATETSCFCCAQILLW